MGTVDTLGIDYRFRRSVSGLAEREFDSASAKVHLPHIPIPFPLTLDIMKKWMGFGGQG